MQCMGLAWTPCTAGIGNVHKTINIEYHTVMEEIFNKLIWQARAKICHAAAAAGTSAETDKFDFLALLAPELMKNGKAALLENEKVTRIIYQP